MDGIRKIPITVAISTLRANIYSEVTKMRQQGLPAYVAVGVLEGILSDLLKEQAMEVEVDYKKLIDSITAEKSAEGEQNNGI